MGGAQVAIGAGHCRRMGDFTSTGRESGGRGETPSDHAVLEGGGHVVDLKRRNPHALYGTCLALAPGRVWNTDRETRSAAWSCGGQQMLFTSLMVLKRGAMMAFSVAACYRLYALWEAATDQMTGCAKAIERGYCCGNEQSFSLERPIPPSSSTTRGNDKQTGGKPALTCSRHTAVCVVTVGHVGCTRRCVFGRVSNLRSRGGTAVVHAVTGRCRR